MIDINKIKRQMRIVRHRRIRARVKGTSQKPRLSVFRSNKHIFLQLIDDETGKTIISVSDLKEKKSKTKTKASKIQSAINAGKSLAESALKKKIKNVVFDRGGYAYQGRVKAAAEGCREAGLSF